MRKGLLIMIVSGVLGLAVIAATVPAVVHGAGGGLSGSRRARSNWLAGSTMPRVKNCCQM